MYRLKYLSIKVILFVFILSLANIQLAVGSIGQKYEASGIKSSVAECQTSIILDAGSTTHNSSSKKTLVNTSYVKEYNLPNGSWPNAILVDKNGTVWTVGTKSHTLINFDPNQGGTISSYPIRDLNYDLTSAINTNTANKPIMNVRMAWTIIEANDGSIWFSLSGHPPLWLFNPMTGTMRHIDSAKTAPFQMKADKSTGNIWYTTFQAGKVGVIQPISEKSDKNQVIYDVKEFDLDNNVDSSGLFIDRKSLWITESLTNKVVKFNIMTDASGRVTGIAKVLEIPSSTSIGASMFSIPADLVVQSDKYNGSTIWLTEHGSSFITRYETSSGRVTHFPTSSNFPHATTLPFWIRVGPDNSSLWFNEHIGNRIAFLNRTDMTLTEYEIPTRNPLSGNIANVLNLAVDPNNNNKVWFSEFINDKIGVVDRSILIPFQIYSPIHKIFMPSDRNESKIVVPVEINMTSLNQSCDADSTSNSSRVISLKTSSSMTPTGDFVNVTTKFVKVHNDSLANSSSDIVHTQLVLGSNSTIPAGKYTIGVSACDGTITRSIFLDLVVAMQASNHTSLALVGTAEKIF